MSEPSAAPRYLYLDDIRPLPADGKPWILCRSAEEAKAEILKAPIDVASLDHDMGECEACANAWPPRGYPLVTDTCRHKMTGFDLLAWMHETGNWPRQRPTVHSLSEKGRPKMIAFIAENFPRGER